jgi:hypothetical protein
MIDECGNATVAWIQPIDHIIRASRRTRGAQWSSPRRLDIGVGVTPTALGAGIGPSGEVVAIWASGNGYAMAASTLR